MQKNLNDIKIEDMNIDRVTQVYLKRAGIYTVDKLVKCRKNILKKMLHFQHVEYLQDLLKEHNLSLRDDTVLENETLITKEMFSSGVFNKLTGYGHEVVTVEDILLIGELGLLAINGFGASRLEYVEKGLNNMGLTLYPEEKIVSKDETIDKKKLYKQLVHGGIIETLEKLPCDLFQKESPEMETIIECVTKRLNELSAEKTKDAKLNSDYENIEEYIEALMQDYMTLVQSKRDEYEKMQKDSAFTSKMTIKIDELKKFHHKQQKNNKGHGYNPFVNDETEL